MEYSDNYIVEIRPSAEKAAHPEDHGVHKYDFLIYHLKEYVKRWKCIVELNYGEDVTDWSQSSEWTEHVLQAWRRIPHCCINRLEFNPSVQQQVTLFPQRQWARGEDPLPAFNLYKGALICPSDCEGVEIDCTFTQFIMELCDDDEAVANQLLNYIAFKIQHPECKIGYHVMIESPKFRQVQRVLYAMFRCILGDHCQDTLNAGRYLGVATPKELSSRAIATMGVLPQGEWFGDQKNIEKVCDLQSLFRKNIFCDIRNVLNLIIVVSPDCTELAMPTRKIPVWIIRSTQNRFSLKNATHYNFGKEHAKLLYERDVTDFNYDSIPFAAEFQDEIQNPVFGFWKQVKEMEELCGIPLLETETATIGKKEVFNQFIENAEKHMNNAAFWKESKKWLTCELNVKKRMQGKKVPVLCINLTHINM